MIANEIVQHVVLPLIPLSLVLLLFNVFAVRRVLGPLQRAEAEVDALDPDNVLLRLSGAPEPREVNTLVREVNRALIRLDQTMAILRGFTANATHELRTPLSIMQLSLDKLPPSPLRDDLRADTQRRGSVPGDVCAARTGLISAQTVVGVRFLSGLWPTKGPVAANLDGHVSGRAASDAARTGTNCRDRGLRT